MAQSEQPNPSDSSEILALMQRFEEAWHKGDRPDLSWFLTLAELPDRAVLPPLIQIDLKYRLRAGETARLEDYLIRFPQLAGDAPLVLDLIVAEYRLRQPTEPDLHLNDYCKRFPALASQLLAGPYCSTQVTAAQDESARQRQVAANCRELYDFLAPAQNAQELGRLGPYRVLKVLGAGGMGIVVQAEDLQLKRALALKVMRPSLAVSTTPRKRFLREAQAAAAVTHDNVLAIFQVGEERGVPYLAMPLLQGETLQARLDREGRLPIATALRIARETARGLEAAHQQGLIHRDVKPANLWLEAGSGRVKILDFGLAHALKDDTQLTRFGDVFGTPAYMAPEQARSGPVDARTDLFSLGCVLYRLCTGTSPFKGKTSLELLYSLRYDEPVPPQQVNPDLPGALADLILRLLAKEPKRRPATAGEVAEQLRLIETRLPLESASSESAPPRKPGRGRRLVLALAGLLVCAGVAALLAFGRPGGQNGERPGKDSPPNPTDGANAKPATPRLRLLVPAYFYPAGAGLKQWDTLIESAGQAPIVAVVNPASGPGTQRDPAYEKVIDRAREAGVVLIGYVSTSYGKRSLDTVKADVDRWSRFYPRIQGFFFDEQADVADRVDYYQAASSHARKTRPKCLIVANPGGFCAEEYVSRSTADVVCLTEHDKLNALTLPVWVGRHNSDRFAAFLFGVENAERMQKLVQEMVSKRIGSIYLTHCVQPNPWDRLPDWWSAEVAAVRAVNQEK